MRNRIRLLADYLCKVSLYLVVSTPITKQKQSLHFILVSLALNMVVTKHDLLYVPTKTVTEKSFYFLYRSVPLDGKHHSLVAILYI